MRRLSLALLLAVASTAALAHGRVAVGVSFGFPFWGPYWYGPPAYYYPYYYPAPVVVQSAPVTYVEQNPPAANDQSNWWYYCGQSRGYYPYVKECPGGWQRVPPAPPSAR